MKTELLDAYLSGDLERDQAEMVESALRNDKELREGFFQQLRMDAALKILLNGKAEVSATDFSKGVIATLELDGARGSREFSKSVLTEILEEKEAIVPRRWPDFLKSTAVATVAALVAVLAMQTVRLRNSDQVVADKGGSFGSQVGYMGKVQASQDAVWAKGSSINKDGWVANGLVTLEQGVAEIAFNSGTRAFVEGPAKFSIESDNRAFLESGRFTADVTEQASGFTVNTPLMNIVDIGTRFGVSVAENGETEVHVMEGVVEASRSSGNAVVNILTEGSAWKADLRTLSDIEQIDYRGEDFPLSGGDWQDSKPVILYEFDESDSGGTIFDSGSHRRGGPYDLSLIEGFESDLEGRRPRRAPGVKGRSLVFEGHSPISTSLSQEFRIEDPFTLSFWMKIPPRIGREVDDYMIALGQGTDGWKFGCRNALGGGALIVKNGDSYVAGATDLADGLWHHVAVRFIGGSKVDLTTHIHFYVDGKHERIASWEKGPITSGQTSELLIGDLQESGFPGWVDQIAIYDEAISTQTIQKLSNQD